MNFLRRLLELPLLVILMGISAATMYLPAAHAVALQQFPVARAFFYSGSVLLILTAMIALATSSHRSRDPMQSQLASVVGAYLVLPVVLAVPLYQAIPDLAFADAWFEMLSSFTTTGATVFDTPGVVAQPLHFWRALVGWMGGFYILLITVSVLAPRGLGGVELLGIRAPGRPDGGGQMTRIAEPSQRLVHFATLLFPVYTGLTVLLWVGLLVAGDTALIGLCHAMGTLSASGISPLDGLQGTASGAVGEGMIFVFMAFAATRGLWPDTILSDRSRKIWQDPELRLAAGLVVGVSAVLFLYDAFLVNESNTLQSISGAVQAIWGAAFTVLSFLTTTGFQAGSWQVVGSPSLVLLGLTMIGGGVATTAGGIKLLRVYALLRHGERELERIVHPHSIGGHGPVARRLRREGAYLAWIFFMMFGLSIAAVAAALTLAGLGFQDALVFGVASLSNTGQLASSVGDATIGYSDLGLATKGVLGTAMILGRLEILAILAVLAPNSWRS